MSIPKGCPHLHKNTYRKPLLSVLQVNKPFQNHSLISCIKSKVTSPNPKRNSAIRGRTLLLRALK